jgi:hypothetical protein
VRRLAHAGHLRRNHRPTKAWAVARSSQDSPKCSDEKFNQRDRLDNECLLVFRL